MPFLKTSNLLYRFQFVVGTNFAACSGCYIRYPHWPRLHYNRQRTPTYFVPSDGSHPCLLTNSTYASSSSSSNTFIVLHLLDGNLLDGSFTRSLTPFELRVFSKVVRTAQINNGHRMRASIYSQSKLCLLKRQPSLAAK